MCKEKYAIRKDRVCAIEKSEIRQNECFHEVRKTSNMPNGGTMPEDLPTPEKSIQQIGKERTKKVGMSD